MTGTGGPLAGVRVVELAGIGPAPFSAMLLADLGADVVRVDRPTASDNTHDLLNRGKRSVQVDLKHERGAQAVLALAERADVLLEGLRPGVTERLGVGPEQCWAVNPKLVYGRMTGWGQHGPLAATAGHDIDYIALTGMLHAIGRKGGPPQVPANLLGDFGGGAMYLAVGVLAALLEARTSGRGQVVDAAIVDGAAHLGTMLFSMLATGGWRTERGTNLLDTGAPYYDIYETADGEYVSLGALEPQFYAELLDRLGLAGEMPDRDDPANWPQLRERLADTFRQRTRQEWAEVFANSDACVAPVLSMAEAETHPHIVARETLVRRDGALQPAPAPRFSRTPNPPVRSVAASGADAEAVVRDWKIPIELLESGAISPGKS
ncbi:CoA transferase [Saccharopolyspora sp. K220]|uniref:CaiB/BaiF CoA transferase family protein n=1 Tax=Saccharopolyspora soli TaxID=2926618 RepID=UPI001F56953E|nr:CaiB/BaiF CoA-transferase family protein [Saccharopolyspora soli]MCI2416700.1 CoA transferase [Saccharopolyspora soli]